MTTLPPCYTSNGACHPATQVMVDISQVTTSQPLAACSIVLLENTVLVPGSGKKPNQTKPKPKCHCLSPQRQCGFSAYSYILGPFWLIPLNCLMQLLPMYMLLHTGAGRCQQLCLKAKLPPNVTSAPPAAHKSL